MKNRIIRKQTDHSSAEESSLSAAANNCSDSLLSARSERGLFPVIVLLFLILFFRSVYAQDEEEGIANPQKLLRIADEEIFKRFTFEQNFSEDQGYVNEFPNPFTVHQYYIYDGEGSDMLMTMNPSEVVVRTTNKRLRFDQYRHSQFHVKYSVTRAEDTPVGSGLCWIRYSNAVIYGEGRESGIIVYPGDKAYFFTPVNGEMTYEPIADLSDLNPNRKIEFDFIRLDGVTTVYANQVFRFSYEDGIKDTVSFESGAELLRDGNRVRCTFDDFSMRIK